MPMPIHRCTLFVASVLLVASGLAACGDGDDDEASDTTTTEATAEADTGEDDTGGDDTGGDDTGEDTSSTAEASSTTEPADGSTTSEEGSTDPSADDRPLDELLLDPAAVGPGFSADDTLGDGSLDPDLCEGTTVEETWDEQVAQSLLSGTGDDAVIFQQALLRFPDAGAAEAFTATLGDALVSCEPGTEVVPVEGVGDEALLATSPSPEVPATAGIVRIGDVVAWHLSLSAPDIASPLDEALLTASAEQLAS